MKIDKINIIPLSMITHNGLQKIDIRYKSKKAAHLFLDVFIKSEKIVSDAEVVFDSGDGVTSVMLPEQNEEFDAEWVIKDKNGEVIDGYPDRNNHWIDALRYATSPLSMRRGNSA